MRSGCQAIRKGRGVPALAFGVFAVLLGSSCASTPAADAGGAAMTQARLEAELHSLADASQGGSGVLHFTVGDVALACISDVEHDRMRIVSPVVSVNELHPGQVAAILEANFHTALDARYATSEGVLFAAFIHPLGSLSVEQLHSAVRQVANLNRSFGSSYSSGELVYGTQGEPL